MFLRPPRAKVVSAGSLLVATLLLTIAFTALEIRHVRPFRDDVDATSPVQDDWIFYKRYALDILNHGWSIAGLQEKYRKPAGFLYNYFVAGVFAIAGVNTTYVYIVQAALLAISVGAMCFAIRGDTSPPVLWIVFLALAGCLYVDQFRNFTSRLLSENLAVAILPFGVMLLVAAFRRASVRFGIAAGVACGLLVLARPTLLFFPFATALLFGIVARRDGRATAWRLPVAIAAAALATMMVMAVRNYAAVGEFGIRWPNNFLKQALNVQKEPVSPAAAVGSYVGKTAKQAVFTAGYTRAVYPAMHNRPHWLLLWIGMIALAVWRIRTRSFTVTELILATYFVACFTPIVLFTSVSNYGFRNVMPLVPAMVVLGVLGATGWLFGRERSPGVSADPAVLGTVE